MSTLFSGALSMPRVPGARPVSRSHQSNCGQSPALRSRQWWNWPERQRQREALRELADDKHLLDDLGLTRDQALDEAAKPFWR
jgi:uncharacterized protein YjiS (DUF1127 family)